ncbi:MAG: NAD(P)/FAD-dependent oxidoreductase [bacterium]|nr:NAD(P)/FAD-dependent oxidoreductase [bacterium]
MVQNRNSVDLIVVGGGPAGMMAAGRAAELGGKVLLVEKTSQLGAKLMLTGGGRCNITNNAGFKEFISAFGKNGKFLYRALHVFSNQDLIEFFSVRGLAMRVDPDGKVFPVTDSAESVLKVLRQYIEQNKVQVRHNTAVSSIVCLDGHIDGVQTADGQILESSKVILAAGGLSYPKTGSTGDGYKLAQQCGHTIVQLRPGLIPLESDEEFIPVLPGLTLKHILISVMIDGKIKASEQGDLLFTHFGVSGPTVLILSRLAVDALDRGSRVDISLHLLPEYNALDFERYLQEELDSRGAKTFANYVKDILPDSLAPVFVRRCAIPPDKKCSVITREERKIIAGCFTDFRIHITRSRPIEEATVTRGGVALKEIDPQTMGSRKITGLFFCGELMDLDGLTGGYNLQEAFSTGYLAGTKTAEK